MVPQQPFRRENQRLKRVFGLIGLRPKDRSCYTLALITRSPLTRPSLTPSLTRPSITSLSIRILQRMPKLLSLLLVCMVIALPAYMRAAEESVMLSNGVSVKVLYFQPHDTQPHDTQPHDTGNPPLALLVSGGSNDKFMARAQFWLGKEMVERGWAIAVPVSPDGRRYFVDNPQLFPDIIAHLHNNHDLQAGKTLLVGISSGGSAALAIAAQQPQHYLGVVATPGRIWNETRLRALYGLPIYLRIGEKDNFRWNRRLEDMVEVLHGAGANVDAAIMPDARHIFPLDWENLEAWLEGLRQPL